MECGICKSALCKSCTQFVEPDAFSFLTVVPDELTHSAFCNDCFVAQVQPRLDQYAETLEKAKNIAIWEKDQSKETRFFSRKEKALKVENCSDRQETILRLAFLATQVGFNAVIDVQVTGKKITNGTYQTTSYSGSGIPTNVDARKIVKDRSIWQNPN